MKSKHLILVIITIGLMSCTNETEENTPPSQEVSTPVENTKEEEEVHKDSPETLSKMEIIDEYVDELNNRSEWDNKAKFELMESTEGGELKIFFDGEFIAYIEEIHYGEMGQQQNRYYLKDESLVFVKESQINYNAPFYLEGEFDPDQIDTLTNCSYFEGITLFKRIENGNSYIHLTEEVLLGEQERIQLRVDELISHLEE